MSSNYYDLLGVSRSDSYSNVRHSYRDLVKKYHPDVSDLPNAQERFQQVKAAYEVLNHPKKREKYNQISHNEFVSQHGGYTSEEIKKVTEVQLSNREAGSQTPSRSQSHSQGNQARHQSNQNETSGTSESSYDWILQGQTVERSGLGAYALRLAAFIILISVIQGLLQFTSIDSNSRFYWVAVILVARIIYLTVFEALREKYEKIDDSPEPDAYSIPYAVGIGVLGIALLPLSLLFLATDILILIILSIVSAVIGAILFVYGIKGTVLAVGWGVADDYYNLQLDVRPAFWNFLVQAPIFVVFTVASWGTPGDTSQIIILLAMLLIPFLVGIVYIIIYHGEIISEIINRLTD